MLQSLQIMFNLYTLRRSDKKRQWWSIGVDSNRARSFMTQERGKEDRELEENDIKGVHVGKEDRKYQIGHPLPYYIADILQKKKAFLSLSNI